MSPCANGTNQTEVPRLGSLDANVPLQDDDSRPARAKANTTHVQKVARNALERRDKERRSTSRKLN